MEISKLRDPKNSFKEYSLGVNEFGRPKEVNGVHAVIYKIVELMMMKPGTYPTRPYMGIGLVERYRYTFFDDIGELQREVQDQINTYLPEFSAVDIKFSKGSTNTELVIDIVIQDTQTQLLLDTSTKKLSWLLDN